MIKKKNNNKFSPLTHDAFFKKIMEDKIAAKEFLDEYLPIDFKEKIDLSTLKVEKESYVEEDLKRKLSDIVYSIKTKDNNTAFVYVLLEAQSKSDYWMALRLMKYTLLLCERHQDKKNNKLPLIAPIVFYNGKVKYKAPLSFWELFTDPTQAKALMGDEYQLIDLEAMSDDDIQKDKHIGMMQYFMKHIHQRDMLKLWENFMQNFQSAILLDKENGYIYIKRLLWYCDTKVAEKNKNKLNQLILDNLPQKDGVTIMKTIADSYIEEGVSKGILIGKNEGIAIGEIKRTEAIATRMLAEKTDIKFIASVTGLSVDELLKLKNKI